MILAFRLFIILCALFALGSLIGKRIKRNREEEDRMEFDAALRRLWAYKAAGLKEVPEAKR